ncbi:MAG TPA: peroxiredoxin [Flavobacteriaceae bacterium]|nr:peroxiredoxin [Flavobacteriaceae bacterium]
MELKLGDKVPEFAGEDFKGKVFDSKDIIGKKTLVLYFYPKSFTLGCTKEAREFKITTQTFRFFGAEVIGVSPDSPDILRSFHEQLELPFRLLSDPKKKLAKILGVKSRGLGLIPGRETLVIDKEGVLRLRFRQLKVLGHVEEALDKVKELHDEE